MSGCGVTGTKNMSFSAYSAPVTIVNTKSKVTYYSISNLFYSCINFEYPIIFVKPVTCAYKI